MGDLEFGGDLYAGEMWKDVGDDVRNVDQGEDGCRTTERPLGSRWAGSLFLLSRLILRRRWSSGVQRRVR